MYACLYRPSAPDAIESNREERGGRPAVALDAIAREFSPRYERHGDDVVTIDVDGLERLLGPPAAIADELRREAADRGVRVHIAIAGTCAAAVILAHARPGVTIVTRGEEAAALAPIAIGILERVERLRRVDGLRHIDSRRRSVPDTPDPVETALITFKAWGLKTLGELAALPPADLASRLGRRALVWQA